MARFRLRQLPNTQCQRVLDKINPALASSNAAHNLAVIVCEEDGTSGLVYGYGAHGRLCVSFDVDEDNVIVTDYRKVMGHVVFDVDACAAM
ncbi:hypothetical protein ONZ45_g12401 [Pleurotus djamor]|nr:hypothetical protein ONZ45_g12401 [Pleurotus djamor]